jgi:hypothetical protein
MDVDGYVQLMVYKNKPGPDWVHKEYDVCCICVINEPESDVRHQSSATEACGRVESGVKRWNSNIDVLQGV